MNFKAVSREEFVRMIGHMVRQATTYAGARWILGLLLEHCASLAATIGDVDLSEKVDDVMKALQDEAGGPDTIDEKSRRDIVARSANRTAMGLTEYFGANYRTLAVVLGPEDDVGEPSMYSNMPGEEAVSSAVKALLDHMGVTVVGMDFPDDDDDMEDQADVADTIGPVKGAC